VIPEAIPEATPEATSGVTPLAVPVPGAPATDVAIPIVVGTVVVDEARGRVGEVMDRQGDRLQLRPLRGGREWDAHPARVRPATTSERLSAAVAAVNAVSRGERA
jgi:hypothetical protein